MENLGELVTQAKRNAAGELAVRLRETLRERPQEWLVERLIEHILERAGLPVPPAPLTVTYEVRKLTLDERCLAEIVERYAALDRDRLESDGMLLSPPAKGGPLIGDEHRGPDASTLLGEAKDLLYALLFGTGHDGVELPRRSRALLTLTVPVAKRGALAFLRQAAAELGTWTNPDGELRIEYGDTATGAVGRGLAAALQLINDLELNEPVLDVRMESVAQSRLS